MRAIPETLPAFSNRLASTKSLAILSLATSLVFLHRWIITPAGLESFGRIWHLYINYFEYGFNRRSLEGTVAYLTGLPQLFPGAYQFGYFWQSVKLAVLIVLVAKLVQRHVPENERIFRVILFLSPGFLWHLAYAPGNPDLFLMIVATAGLFFRLERLAFVGLLCLGVLAHEAFVFLLPGLALLHEFRAGRLHRKLPEVMWSLTCLVVPPLVLSVALFYVSNQQPLDQAAYESRMAATLGTAAFRHQYWSGYFELFAGATEIVGSAKHSFRALPAHWMYLAIPVLYAFGLAFAVFLRFAGVSLTIGALAGAAMLWPISISYFANDYYRWISFSCALSLLAICVTWGAPGAPRFARWRLNWLFLALLPVSLLGPIGSNPASDPFPAWRFVIEKLART
jgi:hypothetical protein